jgi:hypothetical protein
MSRLSNLFEYYNNENLNDSERELLDLEMLSFSELNETDKSEFDFLKPIFNSSFNFEYNNVVYKIKKVKVKIWQIKKDKCVCPNFGHLYNCGKDNHLRYIKMEYQLKNYHFRPHYQDIKIDWNNRKIMICDHFPELISENFNNYPSIFKSKDRFYLMPINKQFYEIEITF